MMEIGDHSKGTLNKHSVGYAESSDKPKSVMPDTTAQGEDTLSAVSEIKGTSLIVVQAKSVKMLSPYTYSTQRTHI